MVDLFRGEGLPAKLISGNPLFGDAQACEVRVPPELEHRARWLLSQAQFTDAELTYLATGELGDTEKAGK
jgi:hypothetical protein